MPELVGKSRVRIGADVAGGDVTDLLQVFLQVSGAEGTVQTDGQWVGVHDGIHEGLHGLAGECSAADVRHCRGEHDIDGPPAAGDTFVGRRDGRFRIERVEYGLYEQGVDTPFDEGVHLFDVSLFHLLEGDVAEGGIVDVRRYGASLVGGTDGPGHESWLARVFGRIDICGLTSQLGGGEVELVDMVLHFIVGHRNPLGVERAGLDDVRTRLQVFGVDVGDDVASGDAEQVIVPLLLHLAVRHEVPAVILFR